MRRITAKIHAIDNSLTENTAEIAYLPKRDYGFLLIDENCVGSKLADGAGAE